MTNEEDKDQKLMTNEEDKEQLIADKLLKCRKTRLSKKRCVSEYVSTRWYRAPEISLVEKQYD